MVRKEGIARERIDDREVISAITHRVVTRLSHDELDILLNETVFMEEKRLRGTKDPESSAYLAMLRDVRSHLARASQRDLEVLMRRVVETYAAEIHGHFDAKTYASATRVLPKGLALLLKRQKPWKLLTQGMRGLTLSDRIISSGHIDTFDRLVERGTVVLVPTHLSNLDSPVVGFALHQNNLPPMIYGAGINLFTNWLLSYFMDHLGAYKVDRAKQHGLYKECLKEYSQYALERRWHSLFFPGGTRSRSGRVETKLKKGLMGTGLAAYQENLRSGREHPRVYFVPMTINYRLVLEAETLVEDSLAEEGKSRYIITDDEFSRPDKVISFVRKMAAMDSSVEVFFGQPLDPFGNPVNADGDSMDPQGRTFDPSGYVCRDGEVIADSQRDRIYTNRLAGAIGQAFLKDNVVFETHVFAAVMHRMLAQVRPGLDLYRRLLLGPEDRVFSTQEVDAELDHVLKALRVMRDAGTIRLNRALTTGTATDIRHAAIGQLGMVHSVAAVRDRGDGTILLEEPKLALYYANRLENYPLPPPLPRGGVA
ncbi:MAG: 1-acyl-sn-glycerol-3-phosphate acyltransferase [Deltaproteobacteria bacterium]|nr:1-acyl-sn-glycerol-3-phosphate acyltransferase [Deltaproteobacteria bacterium]